MRAEQPKNQHDAKKVPSQLIDPPEKNERRTDHKRAESAGTNRQYIKDAERIIETKPEAAKEILEGREQA